MTDRQNYDSNYGHLTTCTKNYFVFTLVFSASVYLSLALDSLPISYRAIVRPTFANMSPSVFDSRVAVNVGQKTEAESFGVVRRVGVSINDDRRRRRMENLTDTVV